jgi:hypothetical protein
MEFRSIVSAPVMSRGSARIPATSNKLACTAFVADVNGAPAGDHLAAHHHPSRRSRRRASERRLTESPISDVEIHPAPRAASVQFVMRTGAPVADLDADGVAAGVGQGGDDVESRCQVHLLNLHTGSLLSMVSATGFISQVAR